MVAVSEEITNHAAAAKRVLCNKCFFVVRLQLLLRVFLQVVKKFELWRLVHLFHHWIGCSTRQQSHCRHCSPCAPSWVKDS